MTWDEVSGSSGYTVEYCDNAGCTPDIPFTISNGSITSNTVSSLIQGTEYVFQIRANHTTQSLNSEYSSTISTGTKLSIPSNLSVTAKTSSTISLAWDEVTNADGYIIQYCRGSGCTPNMTKTISDGLTTIDTVTGLWRNIAHRFQIKATHSNSLLNGSFSDIINTNTTLSIPANLRLDIRTDVSITLAWDIVNSTSSYEVRYCDGVGCTPNETQTILGVASTTMDHCRPYSKHGI